MTEIIIIIINNVRTCVRVRARVDIGWRWGSGGITKQTIIHVITIIQVTTTTTATTTMCALGGRLAAVMHLYCGVGICRWA